jgi:uncharacterized protein YecE (DUF72 family)
MTPRCFVGTSGWHYEHWERLFYPQELPKAKWLAFYCQHFSTVELNNSFYRLPSEAAFQQWRNSVPEGFVFAVKVSRLITHLKKLRNVEAALTTFLDRARLLGNKLGPLLYQLPPQVHRNDTVLEGFLRLLPADLQHAFEFRHESWLDKKVFEILRRYNVALCLLDMPGLSTPIVATADFAYMRFHGGTDLYASCYSDEELSRWAEGLSEISKNLKDLYIYFNNDAHAYAVSNAKTIKKILLA